MGNSTKGGHSVSTSRIHLGPYLKRLQEDSFSCWVNILLETEGISNLWIKGVLSLSMFVEHKWSWMWWPLNWI